MNLMCPARLILLPSGVSDGLAGERVARIFGTTPWAQELAAVLGVQVLPLPSGSTDEVLREVADQHRGETVVLIDPPLGIDLPAVIEHLGDDWSIQPTANEVTLATYEQASEQFRASIPADPNGLLLELFDQLDSRLPDGGSVLELGSGTGRDAIELERRGHRVRRTDATRAFVEMIRADGHAAELLNALTAPDYGGPYDVVFADAVFLHFSPDQFRDVLRKAASAAPLLAFTLREGNGSEWSTRHLDLPRHFTLWQLGPLRTTLADCGWTPLWHARTEGPLSNWLYLLAERTA